MKRKTKLEILLGNIDKASADLKKAVEESQKRLEESFSKYEHKVEVAHHNSMIINEKQIENII
jgi:hypothetical protein